VVLEDASGKELARAPPPSSPAPLDLKPKTVQVALKGGWKTGYRVRILTPDRRAGNHPTQQYCHRPLI
jgi:hypothetical protein